MGLNIVLVEPEIPQNTGNIARTCAVIGATLHLVKPLGFDISEKAVRRAGLDYWKDVDVTVYENFYDFYKLHKHNNIYICSTKANKFYTDPSFKYGDCFLFGKESKGLPEEIMNMVEDEYKIRVPMINTTTRSLNVANTVNIILYEALRQVGFLNMK